MIDRANANHPPPARMPHTPASVQPWSTPDQPLERTVVRDGQPCITRAAARVHEGMEALPWLSSDQAAGDAARSASPPLPEGLVGLREAVAGYVGERRCQGAPVERVLAGVKASVRRAEGSDSSREATDALMPQVVRWGILAFYDGDGELADACHGP